MAREHAPFVQSLDELMHGQQGMNFSLAEPHTGQLMLRLCAITRLGLQLVASLKRVPHDGRIHAVSQILQVSLQGGQRDTQFSEQGITVHTAAKADELLNFVKAFGPVHDKCYLLTIDQLTLNRRGVHAKK